MLRWELWGSEAIFLKTVKVRLWMAIQSDQTVGDSTCEGVGSWVNQRPSRRYRLRQEWVGSSQRVSKVTALDLNDEESRLNVQSGLCKLDGDETMRPSEYSFM